jgi:predicted nucleic acid-binding protein
MGNARSTKRDIERARQEKAAAKRERRHARGLPDAEPDSEVVETRDSQDEVLAALTALHERFEEGSLSFDDFEVDKNLLMQRLRVE